MDASGCSFFLIALWEKVGLWPLVQNSEAHCAGAELAFSAGQRQRSYDGLVWYQGQLSQAAAQSQHWMKKRLAA